MFVDGEIHDGSTLATSSAADLGPTGAANQQDTAGNTRGTQYSYQWDCKSVETIEELEEFLPTVIYFLKSYARRGQQV